MGLRKAATTGGRPRSTMCKTCLLVDELDDPEILGELQDLLKDPDVSAAGISRALQSELDMKISSHSIARHRRGMCSGLD